MQIGKYINILYRSEVDLTEAFTKVALAHGDEVDILQTCKLLGSWSQSLTYCIEPFLKIYGEQQEDEPDRLSKTLLKTTRKGGIGLLRDLQDLFLIATEISMSCTILKQAALALNDKSLTHVCEIIVGQTKRQTSWLQTRIKSASPQTLIAQI